MHINEHLQFNYQLLNHPNRNLGEAGWGGALKNWKNVWKEIKREIVNIDTCSSVYVVKIQQVKSTKFQIPLPLHLEFFCIHSLKNSTLELDLKPSNFWGKRCHCILSIINVITHEYVLEQLKFIWIFRIERLYWVPSFNEIGSVADEQRILWKYTW